MEVRRIKQRRAELFEEVMQQLDSPKAELQAGVRPFLELLRKNNIPMAVTCGNLTNRELVEVGTSFKPSFTE